MIRPPYNLEPVHYLKYWAPRGVIHVGANDGEEFTYYAAMGIKNLVGFEPLHTPFKKFQKDYPDVLKFEVGWGNENAKCEINVTENDKASSLLMTVPTDDWTTHPVFKDWNMGQWPIVGKDIIEIVKYEDWWLKNQPYDNWDYNFLNMDVQGVELEALEGMGAQLDFFDAVVLELSAEPVYVGEAPAQEVSDWMEARGFERVSPIRPHNDTLFLRKDKIDA